MLSTPSTGLAIALIACALLSGCAAAPNRQGAPARDGNLTFEVTGVEQRNIVGDPAQPGYSLTADGVFVVVSLDIRNEGSEPVTFVDRDQTLIDSTGRSFPTDRAANIYGNRDVPSTRMPPGGDLSVRLAFDVPKGTRPREIVLRSSESSVGVPVALG